MATLRAKSRSGTGPFEVDIDPTTNLERELPTGSGFWAVQPQLTWLLPSDPAVLFGSVSYLYNFKRDVGRGFGTVRGLRHHPHARLAIDHRDQALADHLVVIRDEDGDGVVRGARGGHARHAGCAAHVVGLRSARASRRTVAAGFGCPRSATTIDVPSPGRL